MRRPMPTGRSGRQPEGGTSRSRIGGSAQRDESGRAPPTRSTVGFGGGPTPKPDPPPGTPAILSRLVGVSLRLVIQVYSRKPPESLGRRLWNRESRPIGRLSFESSGPGGPSAPVRGRRCSQACRSFRGRLRYCHKAPGSTNVTTYPRAAAPPTSSQTACAATAAPPDHGLELRADEALGIGSRSTIGPDYVAA